MNKATENYMKHVNNRGNKILSPVARMAMSKGKSPFENLIEQHRQMNEAIFSKQFEAELKEEVKEAVSKEIRGYLKR